jgi:hypothetical protein
VPVEDEPEDFLAPGLAGLAEVVEVVEEPDPEPDSAPEPSEVVLVAGAAPSPVDESPSDPLEEDDFRALAPRSFFAQPDPLKWTADATMAFRTSALWQIGQLVGPASWTPWITSKRARGGGQPRSRRMPHLGQ